MLVPVTVYPNRGVGAAAQTEVGLVAVGTNAATAFLACGPACAGVAAAGTLIAGLITGQIFGGCGQTCVVTTKWANQAELALQQNLAAYMAIPTPRPLAAQQAALANFDQLWAYLFQECNNPQLGKAGQSCINDRARGACKWTDASGACFNWFSGYRDPIANDPNVDRSVAGLFSSFTGGAGTPINMSALLITALILGVLWAVS